MIDRDVIGQRIAELRKSKGLTQAELADMIGVSHQAVSQWERNETLPDIMTIPALAEIFGESVSALLGVEDVKGNAAEENRVIDTDENESSAEADEKPDSNGENNNAQSEPEFDAVYTQTGAKTADANGNAEISLDKMTIPEGYEVGDDRVDLMKDTYEILIVKNGKVMKKFANNPDAFITVKVIGSVDVLNSCLSVNVMGNVYGDAKSGFGMHIGGNVGGSVKSGFDTTCGDVGGNVNAGFSVKCKTVSGEAKGSFGVDSEDGTGGKKKKFNINIPDINVSIPELEKKYGIKVKTSQNNIDSDTDVTYSNNGRSMTINGNMTNDLEGVMNITINGDMSGDIKKCKSVTVISGDVSGSVECDNLTVEGGDVNGDIEAEGEVTINGDVSGDVNAGDTLTIEGDACGDVNADGDVEVKGDVSGDVDAGGDVTVGGDVGGDVDASGDVDIGGEVSGDVDAGGDVTIKK